MERDPLSHALAGAAPRRRLPDLEMRRLLRQTCGLSQRQLADAVGVTRASVARYELGLRTPRGDELARYVDALDRLAAEVAEAMNGNGPVGNRAAEQEQE